MLSASRCYFTHGMSIGNNGGGKETPKRVRTSRTSRVASMSASSGDLKGLNLTVDPLKLNQVNALLRIQKEAVCSIRGKQSDNSSKKIHLVLGNEAADLDSVACSLFCASRLYDGQSDDNVIAVPVICVPRADFCLRNETVWLLEYLVVELENLVFLDDLDLVKLKDQNKIKSVTLVDHNVLPSSSPFLQFHDTINTVIDHHVDEKHYPESCDVTIHMTGSCATLVAEKALDVVKLQNSTETKNPHAGDPLLLMLLSAVLIDTQNRNSTVTRVDQRDVEIVPRLVEALGVTSNDTLNELYNTLKQKRLDQSNLSPNDLLRRDYKQWTFSNALNSDVKTTVGVASFGIPLGEMGSSADDIKQACDLFLSDRNLDILVLMCAFDEATTKKFTRQIAAVELNEKNHSVLAALFSPDGVLASALGGLKVVDSDKAVGAFQGVAFEQGDNKGSRKKAQPALAQFFEQSL